MTIDWLETYTGLRFDLPIPRPEQIDIRDIAHALSLLCRFNGHCSRFYSVAEHCVLVADTLYPASRVPLVSYMPGRISLLGLLHDAAEAYTGDLAKPVKNCIDGEWSVLESGIENAIYAALRIPPPTSEERELIKLADLAILATEAAALMPSGGRTYNNLPEPLDMCIECWPPERAEAIFFGAYATLKELTELEGHDGG